MNTKFSRGKTTLSKRCKGSAIAETAAALCLLVPVILLVIDCVVLAIGASLNDSVCRDAARAAASGPPGDLSLGTDRPVPPGSSPQKRALSVVKYVWTLNMPVKVRETMDIKETLRDVPPAPVGGAIDGEVSVQTVIDVYPPFLVPGFVSSSGLAFQSRHSVAYTYVVPPS
jgi:hypothetical protein